MIEYVKKLREKADLLEKSGFATCGLVQDYRNCAGIIEKLSEQKTDKWIPVEEMLPNSNGVYQTVRKVMEDDVIYYLEGASYFDGQNTWHNDICVNHGREYPNVVAWKPIQPYKKEGAE